MDNQNTNNNQTPDFIVPDNNPDTDTGTQMVPPQTTAPAPSSEPIPTPMPAPVTEPSPQPIPVVPTSPIPVSSPQPPAPTAQVESIQSVAPLQSPNPPNPSKKRAMLLTSIIVAVLILGVSGWMAFGYYQNQRSPETIGKKMLNKLSTSVKSLEYNAEISTEYDLQTIFKPGANDTDGAPATEKNKILIKIEGKSGSRADGKINNSFAINIDAGKIPDFPDPLRAGFEIRNIDKLLYLALTEVPNLGFFDPATIVNQWVRFDSSTTPASNTSPSIAKQQEAVKNTLTSENIQKLKTTFENSSLFTWSKEVTSEKINNTDVYHLKFKLNKEGVKKFVKDLSQLHTDMESASATMPDIDQFIQANEQSEGQIWIGKKDYLPYKLSIDIVNPASEPKNIQLLLNITSYNKEVVVEEPTDSTPMEKILEKFFGPLTQAFTPNPTNSQELSPEADLDNDGLNNQQEAMYGTNPNVPDTDGDGYTDGQEVKNGYNPNGPGKMSEMQ